MHNDKIIAGKTIVVTGATSGIGLATAGALARRGGFVIGVGRSQARCQEAENFIKSNYPKADLLYLVADLSSLKQVKRLAAEVKRVTASRDGSLDVLINNAGTFCSWYATSAEGHEMQLAVNHLAPFLLTHELLPLLRKAPAARIITVSSGSHYGTWINWRDLQLRRHYNCLWAYKRSKLANVLFTAELNRRLKEEDRIRAYAVDPGLVNTEMGLKATVGLATWIWKKRRHKGVSVEEGAATSVFLATEDLGDTQDIYWKKCQPKKSSRYSLSEAHAKRLWELSERMCGIKSIDYGLGG
jgi:NAD(P)-dependent dehydrogenase (short-subunit alcohol dehydrogenase family)